jgi:hypothetical protein
VRGEELDSWLALDTFRLDARQQALLHEVVELFDRVPDVGDAQAAIVERGHVIETARGRVSLPVTHRRTAS